MLPKHFAPISPPIEATDVEKFVVFENGSHLTSASVKKKITKRQSYFVRASEFSHPYLCELRTLSLCSDIVFESSASEGAILTMPAT
jgi:predicted nucleic acid binding AN1-type Zn finger protein